MACQRDSRTGAAAVTFAISLVVILGFAGMAVDLGRLMLIKTEAQSYCDAAALAAVSALDGVSCGPAEAAARQAWKGWDLENESFVSKSTILVQYSTSPDSGWGGCAASSARFVRVQATVTPAIYLLPVVTGSSAATVSAASVAGQVLLTKLGAGLFPFAPIAPNAGDSANFGFEHGMTYAFRWSSKATAKLVNDYFKNETPKNLAALEAEFCDGDLYSGGVMRSQAELLLEAADAAKDRGFYIAPGGGGSASGYRNLVLNGATGSTTWGVGDSLSFTPAAKQTILDAMMARISNDRYPTAWRYTAYKAANDAPNQGNFLRMVYVPITGRPADSLVEGFRGFLLGPVDFYNKGGNEKWCAEYVGPLRTDGKPPVGDLGIYEIRLVR